MSLPVVNLTSDSEDGEDDVYNSFIVSSNKIPASLGVKETTPKYTCSCKCNHKAAQVDPLFRIIFRDEHTARKYRLRIEDILKYVLTSKINDDNSESSVTDLVLEVYDPATVAPAHLQSPRVPSSAKKIQVDPLSNHSTNYQSPQNINYQVPQNTNYQVPQNTNYQVPQSTTHQTTHHVDSSSNVSNKKIKQEKIIENEKKRKMETKIPQASPSNNHDLADRNLSPMQKKIKVERTTETKTPPQRAPEPMVQKVETNDQSASSSALTIIYQKILKQEYSQEKRILETCFENNSVQIGSYGYFHQDKSIFISKDGLTFFVPTFKKGRRLIILSIELDEITKVLTHFSETRPALFFFVTRKTTDGIRKLLNMDDPKGPYIDAGSMSKAEINFDPIHQRIAILPSEISEESKDIIRQLFKNTQIIGINENYAQGLLGTVTPMKSKASTKKTPLQESTGDLNSANDLLDESKSFNETENSSRKRNQIQISSNKNARTILFCRVLRVGSYEYSKRRVFSMDISGLKFCMPHCTNDSYIITVNIKIEKIVKFSISFSEACPVIFVHVTAEAAQQIRLELGMEDPNGPYLDPDSGDETCNKIIILPQQLSETSKIIPELNKTGLIETLTEEVANNILIKSFSKTTEPAIAVPESNESSNKNLRVSLLSNSLRIGTYKCVQLEINVIISNAGLNFHVPKVGDTVFKSITISFKEMTKVYYCFRKVFALFFCTTVACAEKVRCQIDMPESNKSSVYFSPNSRIIAEQRLVVIFNQPKFHQLSILKNLLNHTLSEEITAKVARQMILNKL